MEMFIAGWMTAAAGIWRQGEEDPEHPVRVPVPVYLIETDTQRILIDTGLHPAAVADADAHYGQPNTLGLFAPEQEQSIAEQIDLATVTKVVLTHLHFDHAGALSLLPISVPLVIQRSEWDAGHDDDAVRRNFLFPRDYAGSEREVLFADGDHDVLGDGSIELLLTSGHTPGHQSVRAGAVVIGADVVHFAGGLDDHRFPAFGDDLEAQGRSADRLRELRDSGLTVRPGHDPDVLRAGPVTV
jgi:N-acyl homoserine lactone hydrolase